jgi:hypothetical protein
MKCILSLFFILFNTFLFGQNMYLAKPVTHFVEVYDEKGNLFGGNVGSIKAVHFGKTNGAMHMLKCSMEKLSVI